MKTFFTLLFLIIATNIYANHELSELQWNDRNNQKFTILLDETSYASKQGSVTVLGVEPGEHRLRIMRLRYNYRTHEQQRQVVFNGIIEVQEATRYEYELTKNGLHLFDYYALQNDDEQDWNWNQNTTWNQDEHNCNHNPNQYNNYTNNLPQCHAISNYELNNIKVSIKNAVFEDTRKSIAQVALKNQQLQVDQVMELLRIFTFEDTKLELAKQWYANTCDKQNYYRVGDVFTFSSSVDELNRYLM